MKKLAVLAALLFAAPVLAEDPVEPAPQEIRDPQFGGCSKSGILCAGPDVAVTLIGYDLNDKKLQTGIMPGLGYSLSYWAQDWYSVGFGLYAAIRQEDGQTNGSFTMLGSFARYVRFGVSRDVISASDTTPAVGRWIIVGGFGAGF